MVVYWLCLLSTGNAKEWAKSDINAYVSTDVYVKMTDIKRYPSKLPELYECLNDKLISESSEKTYPEVFVSYCWSNSKDAVAKGQQYV